MRARYHGEPIPEAELKALPKALPGAKPSFNFMFGDLSHDPANRLPEGQATIDALRNLGIAMADDLRLQKAEFRPPTPTSVSSSTMTLPRRSSTRHCSHQPGRIRSRRQALPQFLRQMS